MENQIIENQLSVPVSEPQVASFPKPTMRRPKIKQKVVSFDSPNVDVSEGALVANPSGTNGTNGCSGSSGVLCTKPLVTVMGFGVSKIHVYVSVLVLGIAGYFIWTWYNKRNELKENIRSGNSERDDYEEEEQYYKLTPQQYAMYRRLMQNMMEQNKVAQIPAEEQSTQPPIYVSQNTVQPPPPSPPPQPQQQIQQQPTTKSQVQLPTNATG